VDVFSRTFLPAAAEAGLPIPTVSRHMPVFRRCVDWQDAAVLVSRCLRPGRPLLGEHLLLLTRSRLVVSQSTRVLHRTRLHLDAAVRDLGNVGWEVDPRLDAVELALTAPDGLRERFLIRFGDPQRVWHVDALLGHVFRQRRPVASRPVPHAA